MGDCSRSQCQQGSVAFYLTSRGCGQQKASMRRIPPVVGEFEYATLTSKRHGLIHLITPDYHDAFLLTVIVRSKFRKPLRSPSEFRISLPATFYSLTQKVTLIQPLILIHRCRSAHAHTNDTVIPVSMWLLPQIICLKRLP